MSTDQTAPLTLQNGTGTILIIDDEEIVRKTASTILQTAGYSIITAPGGKKGIELFKNNMQSIDLVILDMIMPDLGGKETFKQLKNISHSVKAIISTGYLAENNILELIQIGFIDYIKKPFSATDLADTVHRAIYGKM